MKIRRLILIVFGTIFFSAHCFAQIQTFEWQNVQRQYLVRTPENYESLPVMFFLHGLGDNITRCDQEFNFTQVAADFGWMVVIPQALNEGYGSMWNAGLTASTTNDSGFLMALLDSLAMQYPVNQDSIFFTGFSMGGFMSHRMAIEHGDRINAAAPVSGLITTFMANHTAVAPVRILDIHGTTDPVVGYDGGSEYFGYQLGLSVENILNYWINTNGCTDEPTIDTLPDLQNDGLRFVEYVYPGTKELRHLKVIGGDHSWYHNANQHDIDYIEYIHDFFTGKSTINKVNNPTTGSLNIYPNPSSGKIKIELNSPATIEVIDNQGKMIIKKHLESGVAMLDLTEFGNGVYFIKGNGVVGKIILD